MTRVNRTRTNTPKMGVSPYTKFRVIVGPIQFVATANQIRNNVGDTYNAGSALQEALHAFEQTAIKCPNVQSVVGRWQNTNISIELTTS